MNKDIKIYEILVDYDDDESGMLRNSFVDMPAVEYNKIDFSKKEELNVISFAEDSNEQKFISVSMVAGVPIPRVDEMTGEVFGIVFSKETIQKIVNKFIMDGNINEVSFQHTDEIIEGIYLVEHFITKKGIVEAPAFKDLPDGSWVTTYWVQDKAQYEKLKADESFNGFSIEIGAKLDEMVFHKEDISDKQYDEISIVLNSDMTDEEMESKIKSILGIE